MCPFTLVLSGSGEDESRLVAQQLAKADAKGRWRVSFGPLPPGGPLRLTASLQGGTSVAVEGVLIGLVWLVRESLPYPICETRVFCNCVYPHGIYKYYRFCRGLPEPLCARHLVDELAVCRCNNYGFSRDRKSMPAMFFNCFLEALMFCYVFLLLQITLFHFRVQKTLCYR